MRAKWQLSWTATKCSRATCVTFPGTLHQRTSSLVPARSRSYSGCDAGQHVPPGPRVGGLLALMNKRANWCPQQERARLCLC